MDTDNSVTLEIIAKKYLAATRAAGIQVPAELADGINAATWEPDPAIRPESVKALVASKTEADFKKAYGIVAQEVAAQLADESGRMKMVRETYRNRRIMDAVHSTADSVYSQVIERFNTEAPRFENAAARIPNLTDFKPMDISENLAMAITGAKDSAGKLNPLWNVYRQLGRLTDRFTLGERGDVPNWYDHLGAVFALGDPEDMQQAEAAAYLLFDYSRNSQGLTLAPLAPFIGLTVKGIPLNLVNPEAATDRWDDCTDPVIEFTGNAR